MTDAPTAFAINANKGVDVHIDDSAEDETFVLTVLKDGKEVEKHEGITAANVGDLSSDHFSAETVEAPTAPEGGDDGGGDAG